MVSETAIVMFLAAAAGGSLVLGYGAYKLYQNKKKQQKEKDAMDAMVSFIKMTILILCLWQNANNSSCLIRT